MSEELMQRANPAGRAAPRARAALRRPRRSAVVRLGSRIVSLSRAVAARLFTRGTR